MDVTKDIFYSHQSLALLFSLINKLQVQGDKALQDLTIRQMLAVPAIIHAPDGGATINHIARQLGTSKQSAKQIVTALERKQYLSVVPSEADKRAVSITITSDGELAFRQCLNRTDAFLAELFHEFSTEDLETLWALLTKLMRYDGVAHERTPEHMGHNASDILRYHPQFLKRRTAPYEKGDDTHE